MGGVLFPATAGGLWAFLVLTVAVGGAAAWATGRALAKTWQSWLKIPVYVVFASVAVRFLHFVLAKEDLLSVHYWLVDFGVLVIAAAIAYRRTRARQMSTQYDFAFRPAGPLGWRSR